VLRCVGDDKVPHLFPTFAPKAVAMKGRNLPDTTLSRSIIIEMKRKSAGDRAELKSTTISKVEPVICSTSTKCEKPSIHRTAAASSDRIGRTASADRQRSCLLLQ